MPARLPYPGSSPSRAEGRERRWVGTLKSWGRTAVHRAPKESVDGWLMAITIIIRRLGVCRSWYPPLGGVIRRLVSSS